MIKPITHEKLVFSSLSAGAMSLNMRQTKQQNLGFTLIEVLVALTVFALVSVAISSSVRQVVINADALERAQIARWLAEETRQQLLLGERQGSSQERLSFAGLEWDLQIIESAVPDNDLAQNINRYDLLITDLERLEGTEDEPNFVLSFLMRRP